MDPGGCWTVVVWAGCCPVIAGGSGAAVVDAGEELVPEHAAATTASAKRMGSWRDFTEIRLPSGRKQSYHLSSYRSISRRAKTML